MKKRRMRLAVLLMAAMMLCGLAVAEPVHEHQWSAWQKSADHPSQETRTCLECSAVETREHEWGAWIDQGDGTEPPPPPLPLPAYPSCPITDTLTRAHTT